MKFSELKGAVCHKIHGNSISEYCHQIVWNKKNNRSKKYKIQKKSRMDKLHLLFLKAC